MENQVGQKEGPAEYFLLVDFSKLGDVLTFILILCHSGQVFIFIGKGLVYGTLERTLLLNTITMWTQEFAILMTLVVYNTCDLHIIVLQTN